MINATRELSNAHKNILEEEITEKFMGKILHIVTKVNKMHSRNIKTKDKENEKTQKQINELRDNLKKTRVKQWTL
jgi:hypothetical protein